jgi:hypothetical protein
MGDIIVEVNGKPEVKFVVREHDRIMATINELVGGKEACNFCQGAPIVIVYRGWDDKIVVACEVHEEIVLEMIERDK